MEQIIEKISNEFLNEAKASPRMLEDLASMEKYLAESYDGRTFIELIQNADDAGAKRIDVFDYGKDFVVANDGRPFNQNDIMSICRSGASQKQRGENIGYRGVGFKSTTSISNEIIIYSSDTFFTFSKKLCSEKLGLPENNVPTVRVPFLYDEGELDTGLLGEIKRKKANGFTTFFIFKEAKKEKFKAELYGVDANWLLFLKSLERITIDFEGFKETNQVSRETISKSESCVKIFNSDDQWYLFKDVADVTVAFKYNNHRIVPCEIKEGVFHCYLPTIDSTGFPFKINADFSTDPSRKHIIKDNITMRLLQEAEVLIIDIVKKIIENQREDMYPAIGLLYNFSSINDFAIEFRNSLYQKLSNLAWVNTVEGCLIKPKNVKLLPDWFDTAEKKAIISIQEIAAVTVCDQMFSQVNNLERFLLSLGALPMTERDMLKIISNYDYCCKIGVDINAKIFSYCNRNKNFSEEILNDVFIPVNDQYQKLKNTIEEENINDKFAQIALELLSYEDLEQLASIFPVFNSLVLKKNSRRKKQIKQLSSMDNSAKLAINKWKKPIQNCISSETLMGYSARDVSKKETAYSVISSNADSEVRYITVKQIPRMGDSFTMSESEYEAAQRLGDEYWIFLITTGTDDVEYGYIENPYSTLALDRKVREWEWFCDNYSVETQSNEKQGTDLIDEDILKNLTKESYNTEQLSFLEKILTDGQTDTEGRKSIIAEQINSVSDFYTGREILTIENSRISVIKSLIPTIKQLLR